MKLRPIQEQVVVVFGAASGIGRETALRLAEEGARVVVADNDMPGLDSLVREIRDAGGEVISVMADAADPNQVIEVANRAVESFGRLDSWIHLAAVSLYANFEETTPDEFRRVVDVNLMGPAHGAMAALPHLRREGRGALIFISSVESKVSLPLQTAYSASKHGLTGLVDSLRLELKHDKIPISVTEVIPSSINTPFFHKARTKLGVRPKGFPPIYEVTPVVDAILYAATHPTREIVVGGAGQALIMTKRLSPQLADTFLRMTAYRGQSTDEEKPVDAPDNLYEPLPGYDMIRGTAEPALPGSTYTWVKTHTLVRRAVSLLAILGLGVFLSRWLISAEQRTRMMASTRGALAGLAAAISLSSILNRVRPQPQPPARMPFMRRMTSRIPMARMRMQAPKTALRAGRMEAHKMSMIQRATSRLPKVPRHAERMEASKMGRVQQIMTHLPMMRARRMSGNGHVRTPREIIARIRVRS